MSIEKDIVAKFGGSSLANAECFQGVLDIVNNDPRRRVAVPSAPGKEKGGLQSIKITDLLIVCGKLSFRGFSFNNTLGLIRNRFFGIADGLGIDIEKDWEMLENGLLEKRETEAFSVEYAASRGEWLSGKILAKKLGANFVDAAEIMRFQNDGSFDQDLSYQLINEKLKGSERFVVPGFYGQDRSGRIRTFPRGGSDITGAHLAAALGAHLYENWTDTDGVLTADPKIVPNARTIPYLLIREMATMGYAGAQVFHPHALEPVAEKRIMVNIRNTFNPSNPGTLVGIKN